MVLLHNHEGEGAVGKVIEAVGQVVIGVNLVVSSMMFVIAIINSIGVICFGVFAHNLDAGHSFKQYVLLFIGDSLVAQIPSLPLSAAAQLLWPASVTIATSVLKLTRNSSAELYGKTDGMLDTYPAYSMAIARLLSEQKTKALNLGYQELDCAKVVANNVNNIARNYLS